jgi:hypothetical protein
MARWQDGPEQRAYLRPDDPRTPPFDEDHSDAAITQPPGERLFGESWG